MALRYEAHCPQCLSTLDLSAMYRNAETNRYGLIVEDLAVICGHCGAKLRIAQTRMGLAGFALWAGPIVATLGCVWLIARRNSGLDPKVIVAVCLVPFLALSVVSGVLRRRYVPPLVRLRYLRDDEIPQFPNPKTVRGRGTQVAMKAIGQASYTLRFRSSPLTMLKAVWQSIVGPSGLWRIYVMFGIILTYLLTTWLMANNSIPFRWMTMLLTFIGTTAAIALIFSLVTLLKIGSTSCIIKLGPDGINTQMGRVSSECHWQDVKCVEEREGSIVIEYNASGGVKVPDRVFADATARLKFLDDVRRWHELANAANAEHA